MFCFQKKKNLQIRNAGKTRTFIPNAIQQQQLLKVLFMSIKYAHMVGIFIIHMQGFHGSLGAHLRPMLLSLLFH